MTKNEKPHKCQKWEISQYNTQKQIEKNENKNLTVKFFQKILNNKMEKIK